MTREAKRIAAALAAVDAFLQQERPYAPAGTVVRAPSASPSLWAAAGRLDQMGMRAARAARRR